MSRKYLFGLLPILAVLASAMAPSAFALKPSKPCTKNILCTGNEGTEGLRDDFTEPPEGVSGGSLGSSILGSNTAGPLRLTIGANFNENPQGYAFFGVKLHSNPETSTTVCREVEGWVTFVDIQRASGEYEATPVTNSPVFDDTSPGDNGPWPIGIHSNQTICGAKAGKVTIEHVALYLPVPKKLITGTLIGVYVQPSTPAKPTKCPAGGIALEENQNVTINGKSGEAVKIQAGASGVAVICFVSSNNWVFPKTAPTWSPFMDFTESETPGIWKD
jgi:hypothetical protein